MQTGNRDTTKTKTAGNTGTGTETAGATATNTNPGAAEQQQSNPNETRIILDESSKGNLVVVPTERKGPGRPRKDGSKADNKAASSQPKKSTMLNYADISALIDTVFAVVSIRAGENWVLKPGEADTISKPLCRIFEKMNIAEQVSEISDGAALVLALIAIVGPRVMESLARKQDKNKKVVDQAQSKVIEYRRAENEQPKQSGNIEGTSNANIGESEQRTASSGDYIKAVTNSLNQ